MQRRVSRRAVVAALGASVLAGCLGEPAAPEEPAAGIDDTDDTEEDDQMDQADVPVGNGVVEFELDGNFEIVSIGNDPPSGDPENAPPFGTHARPLPISPGELADGAVSGGPPKDGIPSVDDPVFVQGADADFINRDDTVFGVAGENDVKAYPRSVLVWHEIVNDVIDGTNVAVTYCPLTGTAQGFVRGDTEFGVSGRLFNNNLIMHDRAIERWWPQIPAVSVPSPWSDSPGGVALSEFEVIRTTWGRWFETYPDTELLTLQTGFARDYNRDPYVGYYTSESTLFPSLHSDDRFHPKDWVYGARTEEGAVAFHKETLQAEGLIDGRIGQTPHVAVYDEVLDTAYVYRNSDAASFAYDDGVVTSDDGGEYAPEAVPLDRVVSFDAFWFAWAAYYPTSIGYAPRRN